MPRLPYSTSVSLLLSLVLLTNTGTHCTEELFVLKLAEVEQANVTPALNPSTPLLYELPRTSTSYGSKVPDSTLPCRTCLVAHALRLSLSHPRKASGRQNQTPSRSSYPISSSISFSSLYGLLSQSRYYRPLLATISGSPYLPAITKMGLP